ncbi:hypothetical protein BDP27DRAFT_1300480, partial [Rhodocollybia butyracea]
MKIAVVGSGVAGLAATWALNEYSEHEVHLYESDSRVGGHANTIRFHAKEFEPCNVDCAFIAFNRSTYPNFLNFLALHKSIRLLPTTMSFSVSKHNGAYEWSGKNAWSVFSQRKRLFDPGMWKLLYDILRFNASCKRVLFMSQDMPIGDFLKQENYSPEFCDNYLLPMAAGIWSTPTTVFSRQFSTKTLVQFMYNHQLLRVVGPSEWLTIEGGSQNYVNEIISHLPSNQLHLSTEIRSLTTLTSSNSKTAKVELTTTRGETSVYDHVVLACHSDTALSILNAGGKPDGTGGITHEENRILSLFKWIKNECVVHTDIQLMPQSRRAWACWNYMSRLGSADKVAEDSELISITFNMNELQHLPASKHGPVLITLNPAFEPRPESILSRWSYDHPLVDSQASVAQDLMRTIQGTRSISYAGAYLKYGFHEDGFTAGVTAAELAVATSGSPIRLPFEIVRDSKGLDRLSLKAKLLAWGFDFFEYSGMRRLVGGSFRVWLFLLR